MRFSNLIVGACAAAAIVLASPLASVNLQSGIAGSVVTDKGVTYEMQATGNDTLAFDATVDSGYFPRPVTYQVNDGYHCVFYREATRGTGSPVGEFAGPASGSFDEWVAFYKCWSVNTAPSSKEASTTKTSIPCGFVIDEEFGGQYMRETGYRPDRLAEFAVNGVGFAPHTFHVQEHCACWFYSAHNSRGGAERLSTADGPADGTFTGTPTTRYACWR